MKSACWLCGEQHQLRDSHVIPKFVFKWLIVTGGTPYLRMGREPNRRVQDGLKLPLYCGPCETRMSVWENHARQKIFLPSTNGADISGRYGPWLSRYACSLAMRVIHSQKHRQISQKYTPSHEKEIENADKVWRNFLNGNKSNPGKFRQKLFYPGYFDHFDADDLPTNWNTWVKRSVECDLLFSDTTDFVATFVKTGPLVFVGVIVDENRFTGSDFIRCGDGRIEKNFAKFGRPLWDVFKSRARNAQIIASEVSEKQRNKTEQQIQKNVDRFRNSDLANTLDADLRQFGRKQ